MVLIGGSGLRLRLALIRVVLTARISDFILLNELTSLVDLETELAI